MTTEEILKKYKEEFSSALTDLKTPGQRHKQIPNILTFARLLSPIVILPASISGNTKAVVISAAGFGLTDMLDGYIARKWHLSSQLGADLDAVTDKIYVGTLLLAGSINNPYLLVNTALEGVIASINLKQKMSDNKPSSTMMGKIKTGAIFTLSGLSLVSSSSKFLLPMALTTAALQTMTIASYIKKYDSNKPVENNELIGALKEEKSFLLQELQNDTSVEKPKEKIK